MANLTKLKDAEAHATYIVTGSDKRMLKELKIYRKCKRFVAWFIK